MPSNAHLKQIEQIKTVLSIDWGQNHCVFIDNKFRVFSFGQNLHGKTGLAKSLPLNHNSIFKKHKNHNKFQKFINKLRKGQQQQAENQEDQDKAFDPITNVLIKQNLSLKSKLLNESTSTQIPIMIKKFFKGNDKAVDVTCGQGHSLLITQNNQLFSWGEGFNGKLGLGYSDVLKDCQNQHFPKQVLDQDNNKFQEKIQLIGCGKSISVVLNDEGKVFLTGKHDYQKASFEDLENHSFFIQIHDTCKINLISVGYDHFSMLDDQGQLWLSGSNKYGCLGLSDTKPRDIPIASNYFINNRIIDIACGEHFTVVIAESFQFNEEQHSKYFMTVKDKIEAFNNHQSYQKIIPSQKQLINSTRTLVNQGVKQTEYLTKELKIKLNETILKYKSKFSQGILEQETISIQNDINKEQIVNINEEKFFNNSNQTETNYQLTNEPSVQSQDSIVNLQIYNTMDQSDQTQIQQQAQFNQNIFQVDQRKERSQSKLKNQVQYTIPSLSVKQIRNHNDNKILQISSKNKLRNNDYQNNGQIINSSISDNQSFSSLPQLNSYRKIQIKQFNSQRLSTVEKSKIFSHQNDQLQLNKKSNHLILKNNLKNDKQLILKRINIMINKQVNKINLDFFIRKKESLNLNNEEQKNEYQNQEDVSKSYFLNSKLNRNQSVDQILPLIQQKPQIQTYNLEYQYDETGFDKQKQNDLMSASNFNYFIDKQFNQYQQDPQNHINMPFITNSQSSLSLDYDTNQQYNSMDEELQQQQADKYLNYIKKTKEGRNLLYQKILESNGYKEFFGNEFCIEQLDSELKDLNKDQKSELMMILFESLENDFQKFDSVERKERLLQIQLNRENVIQNHLQNHKNLKNQNIQNKYFKNFFDIDLGRNEQQKLHRKQMQRIGNPKDIYNDMKDIKNYSPCMIYLNGYQLQKKKISISKSIIKKKAENMIFLGKENLRSLSQQEAISLHRR